MGQILWAMLNFYKKVYQRNSLVSYFNSSETDEIKRICLQSIVGKTGATFAKKIEKNIFKEFLFSHYGGFGF